MPTSPRHLAALVTVAAALAGPHVTASAASVTPAPAAVVALVDTGIDPYHAAFRDTSPRAYQHPSTYLPGYPKDAIALRLTLGARDYAAALRADCDRVWPTVKPGRLYWFPGTRIVGAIGFDLTATGLDCTAEQPPPILDVVGHGTMTASRAAGARYGACPACRVVSIQFQTGFGVANMKEAEASAERSIAWAAANSGWIDAQSNSWGVQPVYDATGEGGLFFDNPSLTRAVEDSARRHLSFWSTGNGVANFAGVAGMPAVGAHFTPSAIRVGGQDSGYAEAWPGFTPHVVADACDSWAAKSQTMGEYGADVGGGTSAAAPYVAGGAAATLLSARTLAGDVRTGVRSSVVARGRATKTGPLADGVLTLAEWRDVVLRTATARPGAQPEDGKACADPLYGATPLRWADAPAGVPEYVLIGYGAVDRRARSLAQQVLAGRTPLPDRADADRFFATDRQAREAAHTVFRGP